ncbi:MAG: NACHT domain-containing protein [Cocleimonas sp.]
MELSEVFISLTTVIAKISLKSIPGVNLVVEEFGSELIDVIKSKVSDKKQQRQLNRLFEQIAEDAAENLQKLVEDEKIEISDSEKEDALYALVLSFEKANVTSVTIVKSNLDPVLLEQNIIKSGKVNYSQLSSGAKNYFDILLRDSCAIAIEIVRNTPNISLLLSGETLKRTDAILDSLNSLFEQLSSSTVSHDKEYKDFETRYLRSLSSKLSQFTLFGLDVSTAIKKLDLDVSYISLSAEINDGEDYIPYKIEEIISKQKNMIISGSPGSGKTTLLHWLGLMASKQSFPILLSSWNDKIPLIVPLREYSNNQLPKIEDLTIFAGEVYSEIMPVGWVTHLLKSGKAIILIDGLDEIPNEMRNKILDWVSSLVSCFPKASFIVTSRPNAISDDWSDLKSFELVKLLPMTPQNISLFIEHWHEAAISSNKDDLSSKELQSYKKKLKVQISENTRLRNLASSPLLCAMLCALNVDRNAILPQERGELYRIVMEVLLERRDSERKIFTSSNIKITRAHKEILLQSLAYWMLQNKRQTVPRADVENCFRRAIQIIPTLLGKESGVVQHLIERSSIIREPSVGNVDFVHKTFSEYLAAKQIVEEDSIDFLIENAHKDEWKEVVLMASALTNHKQSDYLLESLIRIGYEKEMVSEKYSLHLLAVIAKESTIQLSPLISKNVDQVFLTLLPPKTYDAVLSIASTGDIAISYLRYNEKHTIDEQLLSIRALTLIGGEDAIGALATYTKSSNAKVIKSLINNWEYFDQLQYTKDVISKISKIEKLVWPYNYTLNGVEYLNNVNKLIIDSFDPIESIAYQALSQVSTKELTISSCKQLSTLDCLKANLNIEILNIINCEELNDVEELSNLSNLRELKLTDCIKVWELPQLKTLTFLKKIALEGLVELGSISNLKSTVVLETIVIERCPTLDSLYQLFSCKSLTNIQTDETYLIDTLPDNLRKIVW